MSKWSLPSLLVSFLLLNACGAPKLDLESDQTYTESVARIRASLDTDEERAFLAQMLKSVRAWRDPEHEELMEVPTLTPKQEQRLAELDLEHQLRLYELLHDKELAGITHSYNKLVISGVKSYVAWLEEEIDQAEILASIEVELLELPLRYKARSFPGVRPSFSRDLLLKVTNSSSRVVSRQTKYLGIECGLRDQSSCGEKGCLEAPIIDPVVEIKDDLKPGETGTFGGLDTVLGEMGQSQVSERQITGVEATEVRCWATSVKVREPGGFGEPQLLLVIKSPEVVIAENKRTLAEAEQDLQRVQARKPSFDLLFEEWKQAQAEENP